MFFEYLGLGVSMCFLFCLFYINEKLLFLEEEIKTTWQHAEYSDNGGIPTLFRCNICNEVPKSPISSFCGHIFCWACYNIAYNRTVKRLYCPSCFSYNNINFFIPIYDSNIPNQEEAGESRPMPTVFDGTVLKLVNLRAALFSKSEELSLQEFVYVEISDHTASRVFASVCVIMLILFVCMVLSNYD